MGGGGGGSLSTTPPLPFKRREERREKTGGDFVFTGICLVVFFFFGEAFLPSLFLSFPELKEEAEKIGFTASLRAFFWRGGRKKMMPEKLQSKLGCVPWPWCVWGCLLPSPPRLDGWMDPPSIPAPPRQFANLCSLCLSSPAPPPPPPSSPLENVGCQPGRRRREEDHKMSPHN